jgi:hypothetical protein
MAHHVLILFKGSPEIVEPGDDPTAVRSGGEGHHFTFGPIGQRTRFRFPVEVRPATVETFRESAQVAMSRRIRMHLEGSVEFQVRREIRCDGRRDAAHTWNRLISEDDLLLTAICR